MKIIGTFGLVVTVSVALLQPAQGRSHGGGGGARSFSGGHFSSAGHYSGRSAGFSRGGGGYYRGGAGYSRAGAGNYRGGAYYRGGGRYSQRAASTATFRNRAYANAGSRNVATVNRATAIKPGTYSTSGAQWARRGAGPAQTGGGGTGGVGTGGGGTGSGGRVPSSVSNGWDRTCDHTWNGHHCRWYNNAWIIIDPWWAYYPWSWGYGYPYGGYYGGYYGDYYYDDGYANGYADEGGYGDANVREVQAVLARKGYYHGAIDGSFGPATRDAVRQYQINHGLEATGRIDGSVIGKLGLR